MKKPDLKVKPELLKLYSAVEIDPSWLPFLMYRFQTFFLPTEFVMREPGFVTPTQGRIYSTDIFVSSLTGKETLYDRNTLYDYGRKARGKDFHGVWDIGEEVFMVEHYEDHGDDGHVEMQLRGYVFVRQSDLEKIDRFGRKEFKYIDILHERQMTAWRAAQDQEIDEPEQELEGTDFVDPIDAALVLAIPEEAAAAAMIGAEQLRSGM